ncbi:MAG: hypothetical protein IJF76_00815 [Clostridia bacterium]|nr:hypothetical protein [Clostridia bacterium]
MAKYCLIGEKLGHSLSKDIHERFGYDYDLVELGADEVESFVRGGEYDGFNVTIPYKKIVMEYLDYVDDTAKAIGAVNTVVRRSGKTYGYNTDVLGMDYAMARANITLFGKKVMILGSGGTSLTARYLCKMRGAKDIVVVSRSGEVNYSNCYDYDVDIVINTTPVGMYPKNGERVLDLAKFKNLSGVFDPIYNPLKTDIIIQAEERGLSYSNGLKMLVAQAKYAKDLFFQEEGSEDIIERVYSDLKKNFENVVLIGMPGCGKSTVGKKLALLLGKKFVDTDEEIVKRRGMSIPRIFEKFGEDDFRKTESEVISDFSKERGQILSLGGGAIKRAENVKCAKQNGVVVYIKRDLNELAQNGRPLSRDKNAVLALYEERKELYESSCDIEVLNDDTVDEVARKIVEELYENTSN